MGGYLLFKPTRPLKYTDSETDNFATYEYDLDNTEVERITSALVIGKMIVIDAEIELGEPEAPVYAKVNGPLVAFGGIDDLVASHLSEAAYIVLASTEGGSKLLVGLRV